ncbi:MAG: sigma 54-interacting transcriptional regulator [Acidobacteria bacterium]|nr:sigma 54-interacting transcriptional regulator [Acidobacteriota bacterium]
MQLPGNESGQKIHARLSLDEFFNAAKRLVALLAEHSPQNHSPIQNFPEFLQHRWCDEAGEAKPTLRGTSLAYLSPEQTGRMNRSVDYRSDFYLLGVVFYELLTGAPPFVSEDSLELIHWHIAKTPPAPAELDAKIPEPVSQIVMKLLAKTAEDRYQSLAGLNADLDRCAEEWAKRQTVSSFSLGEHDVSDRLMISQRLYGREPEVEKLLQGFEDACERRAEAGAMLLVTGYSGIGKTSLIQELYKPIVQQKGYFISGKFDQVVRTNPFGALIQAFRGLIRQLLTESEERLAVWRNELDAALGVNGGVLAEVMPEIELLIGTQQPVPAVGPTEALNRFQLVFQNFVAAIARRDHPLVIFLDDLQWADSATLSLLQPLLSSREIQALFLIGAYRDNEVDAGHALTRVFNELETTGVNLNRVVLEPLRLADLTLLVRDSLRGSAEEAAPLARLVLEKTGGNPFFVIQFLKALEQEGFLTFDPRQGKWKYRVEAIARAPLTDNVVDLMTRKIQRLSETTQRALTLASCIGNQFDLGTLSVVSEQSLEAAAKNLRQAVDEGLLLLASEPSSNPPTPNSYAFLHDRVQQAAYGLITDAWRKPVHLAVGRLLLEHADKQNSDEKLFDIAHHLNLASDLIFEKIERMNLARLNLNAGLKAKSSTAHAAALEYLKTGLSLLDEDCWKLDYELSFALHLEAAECRYLCGDFELAERGVGLALTHAANKLDRAKAYRLRMVQCENASRYADAQVCAREALALFGVTFPDSNEGKQAALESELNAIQSLLNGRSIASLIDLPTMTDPEIRMVLNILTTIWSSTYILGDAILARLFSATMVRLSLTHGNAEESAYGYVTHAITVGPVLQDYESAYQFGRLALAVNERFNDSRLRAKIYQQVHAHVNLWRKPMRDCVALAREACRSGLESGDFLYAAYGASTEAWPAMLAAQDLSQFVRELSPNLALIKKLKITGFADSLKLFINWAKALRGDTESPLSLSDQDFDENAYIEAYRGNPFFTMFHAVVKLKLCYLFDDDARAMEMVRIARENARHLSGTIWPVEFDFWNGLLNCRLERERDSQSFLEAETAKHSLAILAESCPENFLCWSLLLSAEIERVSGRELSAMELYERAIACASETGTIQHQALANELYARFWLERKRPKIAAVFFSEARDAYARWGATAKVADLERRHPEFFTSATIASTVRLVQSEKVNGSTESLDFSTVMKAARAIAGEIELDKLLDKLMRIVIENAGAERGYLILEQDDEPHIRAEGSLDATDVKPSGAIPLPDAVNVPISIINYVRRTRENVVLADAASDDRFARDPYIARRRPRSVLCALLTDQGRLVGVLYLENNQAAGVFTPDRILICQMLSAQAAISLDNARLYGEMKQEIARRTETERILRSIAEGTAAVTGSDFFASLVRHLAATLRVSYAFITQCSGDKKTHARTLAFWMKDHLSDNIEYDISQTPCLRVLEGEICHYPAGIQQLFPQDTDLVQLQAESYLGIPLRNFAGAVIGHLAVLDEGPIAEVKQYLPMLKIFAARAGAELERQHAEEELRRAMEEVERLKNRLYAENTYLQEEIRQQHNFEEIVGGSPALLEVLHRVEMVAPTDATVLILGETGTGKELIARAVHNRSPRRDRPLVKVNCGAISAGLVESELFGHVKGAFTGASDKRIGRFELADGGTVFLDEVGELPLDTQVKLLRVLQEQEFEPVGSSRTQRVNVRIIAATNRNLEAAVRAGRFRSDLYYRLNVLPLDVPSLRERRSDISQIALFFLTRFARKFGKHLEGISRETMELLLAYSWPGNIRELQNIIERGVVLATGRLLTLDRDLFQASTENAASATARHEQVASPEPAISKAEVATPMSIDDIQRRHILTVLEQTGWIIEGERGAAKVLNLHPNTLRGRMKKLGITRP